ncbi:GTPase HflX [Temperatibacter marinus]|uniref:GTPase HflX n=1 Tax=Temperatibacter marinus TaxID=1456591 RepID=A0AA52H9B2_9PROT|nr:GTPase HflX [Temperatibacter marinus]WND02317.1 GTPase HflX [Temperatibacter marinus]
MSITDDEQQGPDTPDYVDDQDNTGWSIQNKGVLTDDAVQSRVYVAYPFEKRARSYGVVRSPEARLNEAVGLAEAIDVEIVGSDLIPLRTIRPSTFVGKGWLETLHQKVDDDDIDLIVFDCELSPIQQRNLENEIGCKVIDRTALILEIFGARASTKEGELQVELAHLTYQKSRLVRSWTHLERQRGGAGFLGGPGESQIELDRRIISDRIVKIKQLLEQVTRTRHLHRTQRQKAPYPVVALVGYTNAGKSTLFNFLTQSDVFAEDLLFATLDPTMRSITLPSGKKIILSDTVGFISELPTMLVAAFRATLEEVISADVVLHVRDASHPDSAIQREDVFDVIKELGLDLTESDKSVPYIEALNKIDLMEESALENLYNQAEIHPEIVPISGVTGENSEWLIEKIEEALSANSIHICVVVPWADGKTQAWLRANSEINEEECDEHGYKFTVTVDPIAWGRFVKVESGV